MMTEITCPDVGLQFQVVEAWRGRACVDRRGAVLHDRLRIGWSILMPGFIACPI